MATQNSNNSTKFKDIISKCELISSGSPVVYQLKPKEEKVGPVKRMTIGEKDINKINKTVLLVGETGTGKSTLINALVNFMVGVRFEDNVWFEIVKNEKNQTESQTSDVIIYEILGFETLPYSLTIIDTPGYGDTRGFKHDDMIRQKLLNLFTSCDVDRINAVGLVMKSSDNRLSDRLIYVFNSVMSLFGEDLEKNVVALITHSDGRKPRNALQALEAAKIKCARNEKNDPVHFLFNNYQHEDRTDDREILELAYNRTVTGLSQFTEFLGRAAPQTPKISAEVLHERTRLTACVQNLQDRIKETELKQREVEQIQEALNKHEEAMKKNKNYIIEVDEAYKDKEPVKGGMWGLVFYQGAVCCKVCEETCHYPGCSVAWYPKHCKVMKRGSCTVCTNKCPASDHVKGNWRYVTKTRKVQKTLHDLKEKYEQHKTESEAKLSLKESVEAKMIQLSREKKSLLEESYQHIVRLEQIALNVDSLSTHVHLDFLIEKMKETGDTEKVQKLEEMRSRQDEGTRAGLKYMNKQQMKDETTKK